MQSEYGKCRYKSMQVLICIIKKGYSDLGPSPKSAIKYAPLLSLPLNISSNIKTKTKKTQKTKKRNSKLLKKTTTATLHMLK